MQDTMELTTRQKAYQRRRERELDYSHAYYADHRDEILERTRKYHAEFRANNLEYCLERDREKRKNFIAAHKEDVDAYNNTKHVCECGGKYANKHRARHNQSKKHILFMEKE